MTRLQSALFNDFAPKFRNLVVEFIIDLDNLLVERYPRTVERECLREHLFRATNHIYGIDIDDLTTAAGSRSVSEEEKEETQVNGKNFATTK